ncbi:MAG: LysE family translocator [Paracoccaceae bacterium]
MTPDAVLAPLAAFFVAAASPGPATLAVAATAMASGARAALALGLGLAIGLAAWGVVAAAGLGAVVAQSATALTILRVGGGLYLLYLAWGAARSALGPAPGAAAVPADARMVRRGLVLNLSNPKAVLAWLSVLALGAGPEAGAATLAVTTAACAALGAGIYATYALAFARPTVRAGYRRARRGIEAAVAAAFGYAGVRLIAIRAEAP